MLQNEGYKQRLLHEKEPKPQTGLGTQVFKIQLPRQSERVKHSAGIRSGLTEDMQNIQDSTLRSALREV